jgi:hypothetical protein
VRPIEIWGLAFRGTPFHPSQRSERSGERTNRAITERVRTIIGNDSSGDSLRGLLTMQLGPDQVHLNVASDFAVARMRGNSNSPSTVSRKGVRQKGPTVGRIFIEADSLRSASKSRAEAKR